MLLALSDFVPQIFIINLYFIAEDFLNDKPNPHNLFLFQVPVDSLNKLLEDKKALKAVLLRHVVPGTNLEGKAIPNGSTKLRTAAGEELSAKRGKFVQVTSSAGSAFVVKFDFVASNGVYHAIDQVL